MAAMERAGSAKASAGFFTDTVGQADPELAGAIASELGRQQHEIELIASENIVSRAVLEAQGSVLTNKYAEGYPGKRYYGGCEFVDVVEHVQAPGTLGFIAPAFTPVILNLVLIGSAMWLAPRMAEPGMALAYGVFLAGVYPPGLKSMATWFRRQRGTALGVMVGALTLGSALPYLFRVRAWGARSLVGPLEPVREIVATQPPAPATARSAIRSR